MLPENDDTAGGSTSAASATADHRKNVALAVLAAVAVVLMLHWARDVLIPIALAIFISYTLTPPVRWLNRHARLPIPAGAAVVVSLVLGGMALTAVALEPEARKLLDTLPEAARKLDREIRLRALDKESAMAKMKQAATEIERAAKSAAGSAPARASGPAPAVADRYFLVGTATALKLAGYAIVVIALVYLLLASGDAFRRKLVRISGDTLSRKKLTVEILEEIDRQIQRYLLTHVMTSALYGVVVGGALALIGLENSAAWGLVAGVLRLIPFVGPALGMIVTGVVAYLQFNDMRFIALVVGSQLVAGYVIGLVIAPWITEKMMRINAVTIFVALLFWGWLWGVWGMLLGVPIVMAVKVVCERTEGWQPIAELLGQEPGKAWTGWPWQRRRT